MKQRGHTLSPESGLSDGSVDAGLAVLLAVTPRGVTYTQEEIAFVCGCSRANIYSIEKRAMQKLKRACRGAAFRDLFGYAEAEGEA
jgi:DNA-binding XRE family transcriptional regulator